MGKLASHPGLPGGSFGTRSWLLDDGALVRRVLERDLEHLRAWRNAQQAVLRQQEPLTSAQQEHWYRSRVALSYQIPTPSEILVVLERDGQPCSYGGLTNIEWVSHRAEVSFLASTRRAESGGEYTSEFALFLGWVKQFAFAELGLQRIFTETWASRVAHLEVLGSAGFVLEGRMRNHIVKDGVAEDSLLHGLIESDLEVQ